MKFYVTFLFLLRAARSVHGNAADGGSQRELMKHVEQRGTFEVYDYPAGMHVGCLNANGLATSNITARAEFVSAFRQWTDNAGKVVKDETGRNYTLSTSSGYCGVVGSSEAGTFGCSSQMPLNHSTAGGMGGYSGMNFSTGTSRSMTNRSVLITETWPCRGIWSPGYPLSITAEPMDLNAGECDSSRGKQSLFSIVPSFRLAS